MSEISEDDLQKRIEVLEKQLESIKYLELVFGVTVVIMICGQLLGFIASTSDQPLRSVYQFRDYIIYWFTN